MSQMSPRVHTIAVIGLGLIGGSLAKATKQTGFAAHTMGYSLNFSEVKLGVELGVVDSAASSVEEAVKNADIVVVAVPVKAFESTLAEIKPYLKLGAILTDVGSVKGCFILAVEKIFGSMPDFVVPGHPIAGSENFGPLAAKENLFSGKRCILTPEMDTDRDVVRTVCEMWESIGSMVSEMDAEDHDQMFASVSHLPHLLAYASIQAIADSSTPEALSHSGAGLKDFSRIASSSPEMWADIFLENQENLLSRINTFKDVVAKLEDAIKRNDKEKLIELLAQAKTERDRWMT